MIINVPASFYTNYNEDKPINNDIIWPERTARFFANEYNNVEPEFINVSDETKQILKENDSHNILWLKDYYVSYRGRVALVVYVGQDQKIHFRDAEIVSYKKQDNQLINILLQYPSYYYNQSHWYIQENFTLRSDEKVVLLDRVKFKYDADLNQWVQQVIPRKQIIKVPKIPVVVCYNYYNEQSDTQIAKDFLELLNRKYRIYERLGMFSLPKLMWDAQNIEANFPEDTVAEIDRFWSERTCVAVQGYQTLGISAKPFEIFYPSIDWGNINNDINWLEYKILALLGMPVAQSKNSAQQSGVEFSKLNAEADSNYDNKRILKSKELTQLCYFIEMMNHYYLGKGNQPNKDLKVQIPLTPSRQLMVDTIKNKNQFQSKVKSNPKQKEDNKDE